MKSTTEKTIIAISILGIILASYAISLHFTPAGSQFCNYGPSLNCDTVNKSPWASFLGIPVALGGFIAYLALFFIVLKRKTITQALSFTDKDFWMYVYILVISMFSFQLYLTFVEIYLIHAYCIVCIGSQICTLILAFLTGKEILKIK